MITLHACAVAFWFGVLGDRVTTVYPPYERRAWVLHALDEPDDGRLLVVGPTPIDCAPAGLTCTAVAPELVVALSAPVREHKIPVWEQELSCGAACMNLLHAAHAMGFAGGWVTGWAAYSDMVRDAFGREGERIAGFIFLGTPGVELEERPRPERADVIGDWTPETP